MSSNIIEREAIKLNSSQLKMIESGWGKEVVENSVVEKIVYLSDGIKVKGYIAYPLETLTKKFPCLIWNRGGIKDKGFIDEFNAKGILGQIASRGYVVFASMYRGSIKDEGEDEFGGNDLRDIENLIHLADEFEFTDTSCWGIEGWSRGGLMSYLLLTKEKFFKCAVLIGAISNLEETVKVNSSINESLRKILKHKDFNEEIKQRSVINFTERLSSETNYLIIHGGSDTVIPPQQSLRIAEKLSELGINYRLIILEQGDHFLKSHRKEVDDIKREWYRKYLSPYNNSI
jgi:dipeptidyl aminopeptidase/acylaminoacyl peptidase